MVFLDYLSIYNIGKEIIVIIEIILGMVLVETVLLVLIKGAKKISVKTRSEFDDKVLEEIQRKSKYLSAILAIYLVINANYGNIEIGGLTLYKLFLLSLLILTGSSLIRISGLFVEFYFEVIYPKTGRKAERELVHLIKNLVTYGLVVILGLTILGIIGIDITPMIAGLGIAGIAIGLALQDTLSNFFSGIYILLDKPVKLGDYVKIGEVEGVVTDIGWRSTKIITWNNILVIIPNKKVAEEIITNYFKPTDPIVHVIDFGVEYGSDIDKVKNIVNEVIEEMKKEGYVVDEQPSWVSFREFGESSLNFKVGLCVNNYRQRFGIQAIFLEKLYRRFNEEGIGIPFPTRTVYLKDEREKDEEKPKEKSKKK